MDQEQHGPRDDKFHHPDGTHRTEPPAWWDGNPLAWERSARLHDEGHRFTAFVGSLLDEGRPTDG